LIICKKRARYYWIVLHFEINPSAMGTDELPPALAGGPQIKF
jgi:hypothetical protein